MLRTGALPESSTSRVASLASFHIRSSSECCIAWRSGWRGGRSTCWTTTRVRRGVRRTRALVRRFPSALRMPVSVQLSVAWARGPLRTRWIGSRSGKTTAHPNPNPNPNQDVRRTVGSGPPPGAPLRMLVRTRLGRMRRSRRSSRAAWTRRRVP